MRFLGNVGESQGARDVIVVGAGPVGLTLALDLAWRGIEVTVIEQRPRGARPEPKCNHVAARSMEIFRRLGVADALRNAGLPADYPNDVSYRTTFTGAELARIPIPCRRDRYTDRSGPDGWWPTPEPPHRINQIFLEPILFDAALAQPRIRILDGVKAESVEEVDGAVRCTVSETKSEKRTTLEARFLVGCDGGRSMVRRAIGAKFDGDEVIQRVQSTFIRAPALLALQKHCPAWGTMAVNPRRSGTVYAVDGRECWLVHNYLRPDEGDFESVDRDWAIRTILGVGADFNYEVISREDWFGRRLVADRFRKGRIFISGDAAHIWVPYAGYGMNAGIADATNLSWLLAAHLNGWATAEILDAYEAERHPITSQVSRFAMAHAEKEMKRRGAIPSEIEDETPEGAAARQAVGRLSYEINVQQYCCAGLNFGAYYDRSPIVAYDAEEAPAYTMADYTPSTVPGCRLPHFWLADGRSLYDALGPELTLLVRDATQGAERLVAAAQSRGVPLTVLELAGERLPSVWRHELIIARPDQYIGWRGHTVDDADGLLDRLTGRLRH